MYRKCPQVAPKGKEREQSVEDKYWLGLPTVSFDTRIAFVFGLYS